MSLRRIYETTIIVNAALEEADIEAVVSKITAYIESHGGKIEETNRWGRRRLAYPINKKYNGYYVHVVFDATPNVVPVIERFLVLEDTVLRHLTLALSQKVRDFREKKALELGRPITLGPDNDDKNKKGRRDFKGRKAREEKAPETKKSAEEVKKNAEEVKKETKDAPADENK
jgi:small subunit ribosomal protein S6